MLRFLFNSQLIEMLYQFIYTTKNICKHVTGHQRLQLHEI